MEHNGAPQMAEVTRTSAVELTIKLKGGAVLVAALMSMIVEPPVDGEPCDRRRFSACYGRVAPGSKWAPFCSEECSDVVTNLTREAKIMESVRKPRNKGK